MRFGILCAIVAIAGCKASEHCSTAVSCAKGSYQACTDGSSCRFLASDGQSFACASCADCMSAASSAASWCGMAGTGGNGGVMQTQACLRYLSCPAAAPPSPLAALLVAHAPS